MSWLDDPTAWMMGIPPLALVLFVFLAAAMEYIFPPCPGDMVVLLGFFLAGQGAAPPEHLYAAVVAGGILGCWTAFLLGERYGVRLIRWVLHWPFPTLSRRPKMNRERLVETFERFDERALIINRFVPFVRNFAVYGAGALKLRRGRSMFYCAISHMAFMAMMLWIGLLTAGSWDQILANARRYNFLVGAVVVGGGSLWLVLGVWRMNQPKT
jgi:membrane-associated protein